MKKVRVIHIINSFEFGGAESMLCNLLLRTNRDRFEPSAVALIDDLTVAAPLQQAGIAITTMGMKPGTPNPMALGRLVRHLLRQRPAIVQTWMDHSNLIGGMAASLVPGAKVVWGVHHANHAMSKRSTLMAVTACAAISACVPAKIVLCSEQSRKLYARRGFAASKLQVIPNGFDTDRFRPDPEARRSVRREMGIDDSTLLIGLVARYDLVKGHADFLRAAALLASRHPNVRYLLCGANVDSQNADLMSLVRSPGLAGRCLLIGPRQDIPRIYAALDISTSSSLSEAFPLAVGEAMSCGVPCAVTDVGDSALIVGSAGRIVPAGDPCALCAAWENLLALEPAALLALGTAARERIRNLFDLTAITRRYEAVYENLLPGGTRVPPPFRAEVSRTPGGSPVARA